jgi:hypothetical protein
MVNTTHLEEPSWDDLLDQLAPIHAPRPAARPALRALAPVSQPVRRDHPNPQLDMLSNPLDLLFPVARSMGLSL